jgi:hypothetical protein
MRKKAHKMAVGATWRRRFEVQHGAGIVRDTKGRARGRVRVHAPPSQALAGTTHLHASKHGLGPLGRHGRRRGAALGARRRLLERRHHLRRHLVRHLGRDVLLGHLRVRMEGSDGGFRWAGRGRIVFSETRSETTKRTRTNQPSPERGGRRHVWKRGGGAHAHAPSIPACHTSPQATATPCWPGRTRWSRTASSTACPPACACAAASAPCEVSGGRCSVSNSRGN